MAIRVFIGSSKEQRQLAEWLTGFITSEYAGRLVPIPWYDAAHWPGGRYNLENLFSIVDSCDAAVLFWTADDRTWYRGTEVDEPRDNLTFEAGLFIAAFGRERTQLMVPDYAPGDARKAKEVKIPSDLKGLTFNLYSWNDGSLESTGLPFRARSVCNGLALLQAKSGKLPIAKEFAGKEGVEEIRSYVGAWRSIHINGIAKLAERPDLRMVDVLAAYRVGEITRSLGAAFRTRAEVQLRACFANMWDKDLFNIYHRKYYDRSEDYVRNAVRDSISKLIGPCDFDDAAGRLRVQNITNPPAGNYQLRLTDQRITYGYYRIDECAFIVPLDMKRDQNPAPFGWVLPRESAPKAFDFYLQEYDRMFSEAMNVYPAA